MMFSVTNLSVEDGQRKSFLSKYVIGTVGTVGCCVSKITYLLNASKHNVLQHIVLIGILKFDILQILKQICKHCSSYTSFSSPVCKVVVNLPQPWILGVSGLDYSGA